MSCHKVDVGTKMVIGRHRSNETSEVGFSLYCDHCYIYIYHCEKNKNFDRIMNIYYEEILDIYLHFYRFVYFY